MKKLMFISLLIIPFCKAADVPESWKRAIEGISNNIEQHTSLCVMNRQIKAIPVNLGFPHLKSLNLKRNQIEAIPEDLNHPGLEEIDLANNQITTVPHNLKLPLLRTLILDNNLLTAIPRNFKHSRLARLSLKFNQISYVDPQILKQFPKLRFLYLNKNPLSEANVKELEEEALKLSEFREEAEKKDHPDEPYILQRTRLVIVADDIGEDYLPEGH